MKQKVMIGMSGGVDSSVAAYILKQQGYTVAGATLSLCGHNDEQNINDAAEICKSMGIEHYSFDLRKEFSSFVMDDFVSQYICGKTPNPCIECNKHIKFGKMISLAKEKGFDKIATGHYAIIEKREDGRYILKKAKDPSKDQSYVLYSLTQEQLASTLFPLGDLEKTKTRELAELQGFINANRPDSQDICFVPDGDYALFIEKHCGFISPKGDYVDINGNKLGEHKGLIHYTLGQRKGLGIALGKPVFVIEKDKETNSVVLGEEENLFKTEVIVDNVNFIPFDTLKEKMRVTAKIRYRQEAAPAEILPLDEGRVKIVFDNPQRAASPGQAAVFYDGEIVVGGGTII